MRCDAMRCDDDEACNASEWQMGQPAPEDATVAETARDGEEPLKKKKRGKRGGRNGSDREAEKRKRRAIGDGE